MKGGDYETRIKNSDEYFIFTTQYSNGAEVISVAEAKIDHWAFFLQHMKSKYKAIMELRGKINWDPTNYYYFDEHIKVLMEVPDKYPVLRDHLLAKGFDPWVIATRAMAEVDGEMREAHCNQWGPIIIYSDRDLPLYHDQTTSSIRHGRNSDRSQQLV